MSGTPLESLLAPHPKLLWKRYTKTTCELQYEHGKKKFKSFFNKNQRNFKLNIVLNIKKNKKYIYIHIYVEALK